MAPSLLVTAAGILLLSSCISGQTRGDNHADCYPNDGFGTYCPTTCGVTDYMMKYVPGVAQDLEYMHNALENIANQTKDTEVTVDYMKDSTTSALKSSLTEQTYKKSATMLEDILRFEKTIIAQEQQMFELQNLISQNEREMADLKQLSLQLQQTCSEPCKDTVEIQPTTGADCQDIANKGARTSGLFYVKPNPTVEPFLVYCEIDSFGRGFTVIQRRRDGSVDFKKDWIQYKEGFGYLSPDDTTEFWLGNEKIHLLTTSSTVPTVLRIDLVDWDGNKKYADYAMFRLSPESDMYRLTYAYYSGGDAGDAFEGFDFGDDPSDKFFTSHNGMQFSTFDKDNDKYDGNCALQDGSGWWMNRCHAAHLNGKYYQGGTYTKKDAGDYGYDNGIIWVTWHNRWYSLKETTMKLIPVTRITTGTGQQAGVKDLKGLDR
ncbi:fibrinogen gamma chain [Thalassophryne amazonica]|uniref:fibrinogen gamma chain n=1 Tax=Thalassophryne amazonica TaxID=390379 RepID=UPI00147178F3|nr:fibrinogen gamma chain [Thalassophryne amazonica]